MSRKKQQLWASRKKSGVVQYGLDLEIGTRLEGKSVGAEPVKLGLEEL